MAAAAVAAAQLRVSPLSGSSLPIPRRCFPPVRLPSPSSRFSLPLAGGGAGNNVTGGGRGGSGGGGGPHEWDANPDGKQPSSNPLGALLEGWRARVAADPQFPFKVLMEELVGVSACVLGDMASRPGFGLRELDFVFSTLVVGSILNFVLMYLLAPTAASSSAASAAAALPSHMFQPGPYPLPARLATAVSKGATFAAVGFAAGLAGTAISNALLALRRRVDPAFEPPNRPPPTLLNALTWALHMGVSSNLRYQALNGIEYAIQRALPPAGFKVSVVALRCMNNVLGGASFVMLARLTGSQKAAASLLAKEQIVVERRDVELTTSSGDR